MFVQQQLAIYNRTQNSVFSPRRSEIRLWHGYDFWDFWSLSNSKEETLSNRGFVCIKFNSFNL